MEEDEELLLLCKPEVFVYNIPLRYQKKTESRRATDWVESPFWEGKLKVLVAGNSLVVQLEDDGGKLFACTTVDKFPGAQLECVVDSCRYFALEVMTQNGGTKLIGLGFSDGIDSFDFVTTVKKHFSIKNKREFSRESEAPEPKKPKSNNILHRTQTTSVQKISQSNRSKPQSESERTGKAVTVRQFSPPPPILEPQVPLPVTPWGNINKTTKTAIKLTDNKIQRVVKPIPIAKPSSISISTLNKTAIPKLTTKPTQTVSMESPLHTSIKKTILVKKLVRKIKPGVQKSLQLDEVSLRFHNPGTSGNLLKMGNATKSGHFREIVNSAKPGTFPVIVNTTKTGSSSKPGNFPVIVNSAKPGNFPVIVNFTKPGNFTGIGNSAKPGNVACAGNTKKTGNFTYTGNTTKSGLFPNTGSTGIGNTAKPGNISERGNSAKPGNLTKSGKFQNTTSTTKSGPSIKQAPKPKNLNAPKIVGTVVNWNAERDPKPSSPLDNRSCNNNVKSNVKPKTYTNPKRSFAKPQGLSFQMKSVSLTIAKSEAESEQHIVTIENTCSPEIITGDVLQEEEEITVKPLQKLVILEKDTSTSSSSSSSWSAAGRSNPTNSFVVRKLVKKQSSPEAEAKEAICTESAHESEEEGQLISGDIDVDDSDGEFIIPDKKPVESRIIPKSVPSQKRLSHCEKMVKSGSDTAHEKKSVNIRTEENKPTNTNRNTNKNTNANPNENKTTNTNKSINANIIENPPDLIQQKNMEKVSNLKDNSNKKEREEKRKVSIDDASLSIEVSDESLPEIDPFAIEKYLGQNPIDTANSHLVEIQGVQEELEQLENQNHNSKDDSKGTSQMNLSSSQPNPNSNFGPPFTCKPCNACFKSKIAYLNHLEIEHEEDFIEARATLAQEYSSSFV